MPGGNLGPWAIVELGSGFDDIGWLDPEAGRIRVGAGAIAANVDRFARSGGWFVPFLPSSAPWCRIGGVVANDAAGARSFRFGQAHHWVEAVEGVLPSGEPFRFSSETRTPPELQDLHDVLSERLVDRATGRLRGWPSVRKNASGYALDRFLPSGDPVQLLVGSEGTLAVITDVELRLEPLPDSVGLIVLPAESTGALREIALGAVRAGTTTCEFLGRRFLEIARLEDDDEVGPVARDARALVLLEVSGTPDEVDTAIEAVTRLGRAVSGPGIVARDSESIERLWGIRRAASPMIAKAAGQGLVSTQFIEDSVVAPSRLDRYLDGLEEILADARFDAIVFGHAGDGNIHVNPLLDVESTDCLARARTVLHRVAELVGSLGGTLTGEHGDGRLRTPLRDRIWSDPLLRAFDEVKATFDPLAIMNPGVVRPTPGQDPFEGFAPRPRSHP